ncbi:hypothetical protein [Winogradskyella alexanderae]|uniref:Uncharacterized protein n=1 Tax=Winogradskyella alexanderae TaxID=2877123 RepID=A0ABS7XWC8_9FLAO|nr:hypothetical protein [Winogradskyella alexanderae]MCA0133136.1 hypothetical protein [Winogradskyella alexanderae]
MEFNDYFLVFAILQIVLVTYFIVTRERIKTAYPVNKKTSRELSSTKHENKKLIQNEGSYCSMLNMEEELKRNRRQLRRHIMTLNYLAKIESSKSNMQELSSMKDITSIRQKLHREVIRNTKLVKHYESIVV